MIFIGVGMQLRCDDYSVKYDLDRMPADCRIYKSEDFLVQLVQNVIFFGIPVLVTFISWKLTKHWDTPKKTYNKSDDQVH